MKLVLDTNIFISAFYWGGNSEKIKGICRDKDDDDKLECAILSNADFIITGDEDLLVLRDYETVKIVTQKEYLDIIDDANFR